jgi:hypothetical protein
VFLLGSGFVPIRFGPGALSRRDIRISDPDFNPGRR